MSNFLTFMQRRTGFRHPDRVFRLFTIMLSVALIYPLRYLVVRGYWRSLLSLRYEMYAVRDGVYYKHFRTGQRSAKAAIMRGHLWS